MQLFGLFVISIALFQQTAFAGTRHLGEACSKDSDCIASDYCREVPNGAYRTKKVCAVRGGRNANCTTDAQCFSTLFCATSIKQCRDYRHLGETCTGNTDKCAAGLSCCEETGKCKVEGKLSKAELGQDCTKSSDCHAALFCSNKKCVRRYFFEETCTTNETCRGWLSCNSEKKCVLWRQLGQKCDTKTARCLTSLTCKDSKCAKIPVSYYPV